MPKILESEALALAQNIDTLSDAEKPLALDILKRYQAQQWDNGEPEWPTQARAQEEGDARFRSMFEDLKNVDKAAPSLADTLQYSDNPDADRARVASIAYLSRVYGKPADEIGSSIDLYRNDYTTRRGQKSTDDLGFYKLAAAEVAAMKRKEDTSLEGAKAALRGEDVIASLQAWQSKNLDRIPDSTEFTKGYLKAKEGAGDYLPIADELLKLMESGTGKSTRPFDSAAANRLDEIAGELATMKPRERKQVYASIAARIEAAGYDQKGFWSQMLGYLDQQLYRAETTLSETGGIASDVASNFPAMLAEGMTGNRDFGMTPSETAQTDANVARRKSIGNVQQEIMQIVSGELDPVKPVTGWMNETIETGLIKGPGAVAPFMAASALLGPYGAGVVFTADFAAQNRRELVQSGLDDEQAQKIAVMAAPLQAAVESLSNMVQLGRFTKLQTVLAGFTKPIGGGAGLAVRYAQNAGISLATEFTEEQLQDNFIVPAMQELLGALEKDVPDVDWSFYKTRAAESTPELLSVLAPMALVFGGVMTRTQANLSRDMTGNIDALKALNYSEAQAVEVVSEKTEDARIAKARSLWASRAGDKVTLESGAKNLAERMRQLSGDAMAQQQELERRGKLPILRPIADGKWLMTIPSDGSAATFNSHQEADKARWTWTEDQLGKVHALTRETLASMEKNLNVGREVAVEFFPDIRTAQDAVNEGASVEQIKNRVEQGKVLGDISPDTSFEDAQAIDKATTEADGFLSSLRILGSSKNEFKDGILRTTIKLWEGSNILTLVEEKLEGDAWAIIMDPKGREWMLSRLRSYEQVSGDKLFRELPDEQLKNEDLVEAWSHLGQSYLVGRSTFGEPLQKKAMRRFGRLLMRSGLTGAMNAESSFFAAVASRAQKLGELKQAGKLSDDLVSELEKQLGIDSQVAHDAVAEEIGTEIVQGAIKEAQNVANEVAQQANDWVDDSQFDNLPPSGDTFQDVVRQWHAELEDRLALATSKTGQSESSLFTSEVNPESSRAADGTTSGYSEANPGPNGETFSVQQLAADFEQKGKFYRVIHGEDAFLDVVASGLVRTNANEKVVPGASLMERLAARPTAFPSFSKDYAAMGYAQSNPEHFIIVTDDASLQPSTLGRHSKGKTYFPTDKKGNHLSSLKGERVDIFRHVGNGIYSLVYNRGKLVSNPGPNGETFATSRAIPADASKVVQMPDGARLVGPTTFSIRAYHGTPHKVDKFSLSKIGTGEGAQAYGWGLYFAERKQVAMDYMEKLGKAPTVEIDNQVVYLGYDALKGVAERSAGKWADLLAIHGGNRRKAINAAKKAKAEVITQNERLAKSGLPTRDFEVVQWDDTINELEKGNGKKAVFKENKYLYTVELLPDEGDFLDWDKPLSEQSEKVLDLLANVAESPKDIERAIASQQKQVGQQGRRAGMAETEIEKLRTRLANVNVLTGAEFYKRLSAESGGDSGASQKLASAKIPGIRYLDGGSRGAGDGTRNFVIFDENLVRILEENGKPVVQETFSLRVTPAQDADYLAAVKAGDMATAQRMVDDAAKAGGYDVKAYHGTIAEDFTEFRHGRVRLGQIWGRGFYLTEDQKDAEQWAEKASRKSGWGNGRVISARIKINKPLVLDGEGSIQSIGEMLPPEFINQAQPLIERDAETDLLDILSGDRYLESFEWEKPARLIGEYAQELGYDGIIGTYENTTHFVVFDPNQIKSADPVTYDEAGNIIPLSQRFNPTDNRITFSLRPGDFSARMEAKFSLFQAKPELRLAIAQVAKERVLKQAVKINEAIAKQDAATRALQEAETAFAEEMASLRADYEADEKAIRDERDTELKGVAADKGTELDRERIRRDADKKLARVRLEYERNQKEIEAKKAANDAKLNKSETAADREALKAIVRALDGALAVVPPIVRASVGGYFPAAKITTSAGMLKWAETRIDKLNVELEKWLKKEYSANIKKKLVKFGSDRGKRGVMEGRTIASVTEQIDYADDFSKMSKAAQDVQIDHLEAVISDALSTPEQVDIAIKKLGIAEAFYDFENQEAEALSAVSDWMNAITSAGRDIRKALDEDRREYLGTLRTDGITSILGVPQSSQTDANNRQENIKGSLLKQMSERVKGFINSVLPSTVQQLEDVFGVDSTVANEFAPRIWKAANRSTDIKSGVEAQRRAMLATVFKTKSTLKQIAMLSKLQQSKMSGVFIKEGRKTETVTVPVEILERIQDGIMTAKAAGLTQAEADEALEQWAGASTRTKNGTIERETFAGTQKELQMSEMQALNYLLHWNQDAVRARMENHGWTQASIDQLNTFMSDETKAIGRWMSEMYATAGRALVDPVYRRIFHAPLPMVKNFAPTYYETPGNDSTMAIDAQQNTSGIMASFTKARRPHNYNVRQVDAMTAFLSHFEHVSHWVSFVELLRDMKAVLSAVEVQNAIIAHHGPAAAAALTRRINDTANQGNDQAWSLHEVSGWFNRINQARVFKALAWKISPVVKQTSAFFNPMLADVPAHAYTIGLSKLLTGKLDVEAMWNSDNIQRRVTGGFSAEARIAMQANGNGPIGAVAIKLMQNGMLPMQYTDAAWSTVGAAIAWDYYRGLAVESGQSAAMAEQSATKAVERMLATAAQPADLVNRSLVEGSSNPLVKGAWMFASEPRKNLAIEFYAAKRLLTGKSKNKGMDAQRVIVAHVVMAMTTQLMSGLLALALGDDDDKEREWSAGEWAAAILAGPINGLFVVGDGLRYLSRLALGLRTFRSLPPYMQIVEDAGSAGSHIDDLFNGDDEEAMKELNRLSGSVGFVLSAMFGPAAQAADVVLGNPLRDMAKALND